MHKITEQLAALAVPINSIKTDPMNARKGHALDELARSLDIYGQVKPIVVNAKTKQIEAGNGTYQAAKNLGWSEVAVVMVDHDSSQAVGYAIADNRLTDLSEFDNEILLTLLQSLDSPLDVPGVDDEWMESLLAEVGGDLEGGEGDGEGEIVEDDVPIDKAEELLLKWQCKEGDLWLIGEHRLIVGDCTDKATVARLMNGEKADYGMHDPPYGISVVGGGKAFGSVGGGKAFGSVGGAGVVKANVYAPIIGDDEPFDPSHLIDVANNSIIWGANYFADKLPSKKGWIVWDKKGREWNDNFSDCELAWTSLPIVAKIYRHVWMGMVQEGEREKRVHPTQKPAGLFAKLITDLFTTDCIIIDFYLGSGTTMIATEQVGGGRKCFGCEISPAYCSVILERMSKLGLEPIRE